MKRPSRLTLGFFGLSGAREQRLARASVSADERALRGELGRDEERFRAEMERIERVPHVVLGTTASGVAYRVPVSDLAALSGWLSASTGIGKTRLMCLLIVRLILAGFAVIVDDGKGDLADLVIRALAQLAMAMSAAERRAFFAERVHVLRFFAHDFLPSWPLLHPEPGVDTTSHANVLTEVLCDVFADGTVGARQKALLAAVIALAIEFDIPFIAIPWLLYSPRDVTALAARSTNATTRLELSRFAREATGTTVDGLVARINQLAFPSLRCVLSGAEPFDWRAVHEPGHVTIIDYSRADLGARAAVRALGSLSISAVVNAAFDPRRTSRGPSLLVLDEPQVMLTSVSREQITRAVELGRSFGLGCFLLHQSPQQIGELQATLNGQAPLRIIGRSAERDAVASSEWLPHSTRWRRRRPGTPEFEPREPMSAAEAERAEIQAITSLAHRHFLVSDRRRDFAPRVVEALTFEPTAIDDLDVDVLDAVRRGSNGVARADLEARVRAIETDAAARFTGAVASPRRADRADDTRLETPDLFSEEPEAGRRRE